MNILLINHEYVDLLRFIKRALRTTSSAICEINATIKCQTTKCNGKMSKTKLISWGEKLHCKILKSIAYRK